MWGLRCLLGELVLDLNLRRGRIEAKGELDRRLFVGQWWGHQ